VIQGGGAAVTTLVFAPDGKRLVSGAQDGTIRFWDAPTGREVLRIQGAKGPIVSLTFSADGKVLTSRQADNTEQRWDAATGKALSR
jgi:WD40 repeat protein